MRWRFLVLLVLMLVGVFLGVGIFLGWPDVIGEGYADKLPIQLKDHSIPETSSPTLFERVRHQLNEKYRLRPDRRLTRAFARIHQFFTGEPPATVMVSFRRSHWALRYRGHVIGFLDEYPTFAQTLILLTRYASLLENKNDRFNPPDDRTPSFELPYRAREDFFYPHLLQNLQTLDRLWVQGRRSPRLAELAARQLTALCEQSYDRVGIGDGLAAHSLAMLAIAKSATGKPLHDIETRLAYFLDYSAHASRVSDELATSDPLPHFIHRSDTRLRSLAESRDAPAETRYLWLLRLQETDQSSAWYGWVQKHLKTRHGLLPVLKSGIETGEFSKSRDFSRILPFLTAASMVGEQALHPKLRRVIDRMRRVLTNPDEKGKAQALSSVVDQWTGQIASNFGELLEKTTKASQGPFLSPSVHRDFFRGYFYTGVYKTAVHLMEDYSSVRATQEYAAMLGHSGDEVLGDLQKWLNHMAMSKGGTGEVSTLRRDIKQRKHLGAGPLIRTYRRALNAVGNGTPRMFRLTRELFQRLDTRPDVLKSAGYIMRTRLYDQRMMEKLYLQVLEVDPVRRDFLRTWWAHRTGDVQRLMELYRSPHLDRDAKANVLSLLQNGTQEPDLKPLYHRLVRQFPNDWSLRDDFIDFLVEREQYEEARTAALNWLSRTDETHGFDYRHAHRRISESLRKQGKPEQAWEVIKPHLDSMIGDVLAEGTRSLIAMGELDKAEEVATRNHRRYPDSLTSMRLLIKVHWRKGQYERAANRIASWEYPISLNDWKWRLGKDFVQVFQGKSERAQNALQALLSTNVDAFKVSQLPRRLISRGDFGTAYRLLEPLTDLRGARGLDVSTTVVQILTLWKGQDRALNWISKNWSRKEKEFAVLFLYRHGMFNLLWKMIPNPAQTRYPSSVWLYRTASSLEDPDIAEKHGKRLRRHFQTTDRSGEYGYYNVISKVLLGMEEKKEAMVLIDGSADKRCEVGYFLGLLAAKEKNLSRATVWFRTSVETWARQDAEYRWSLQALQKMHGQGMSLERLSRKTSIEELL